MNFLREELGSGIRDGASTLCPGVGGRVEALGALDAVVRWWRYDQDANGYQRFIALVELGDGRDGFDGMLCAAFGRDGRAGAVGGTVHGA